MIELFKWAGGLVGLVAWIIIVAHAFGRSWWKGLLCFPWCLPYLFYYMFVEFEHTNKWQVILAFWIGGFISGWAWWPWD